MFVIAVSELNTHNEHGIIDYIIYTSNIVLYLCEYVYCVLIYIYIYIYVPWI